MDKTHFAEIIHAALNDPGLKPSLRTAIEHQILTAAVNSPQALRAVGQVLQGNASADIIVADLASEALHRWRDPKAVDAFLDWFQSFTKRPSLRSQARNWRASQGTGQPARNLTPPQQAVLTRLHHLADLYQSAIGRDWSIRPRTNPLLVGPSGSGKTWILETFAKERRAGYLRLTYGNWTVKNARSGKPAMDQLIDVIMWHPFSVICIDELDKVGANLTSDWSVAMRDELFALLDRRLVDGIHLKPGPHNLAEPAQVLRERVFLVGCGTWQDLWRNEQRTVGFQSGASADIATRIDGSNVICEELRRRFDARLLALPPLSAADLQEMAIGADIETAAQRLGVRVDYAAGAASGLGVRWLENLRTDLELVRRGVCPRELGFEELSVGEQLNPDQP